MYASLLITATGKMAMSETIEPDQVPREFLEGDVLWMYVVVLDVPPHPLRQIQLLSQAIPYVAG